MSTDAHIHQMPESSAVHLRGVAWAAGGALLLLAGSILSLTAIYRRAVQVKAPPPPQEFSQPRVDTQETVERGRLIAAQTKRLETWRWANDQHTVVQIPIERAMELLAQKGGDAYAPLLPPQPALASPTAGAQRALTPDRNPGRPTFSKNPPSPQDQQP